MYHRDPVKTKISMDIKDKVKIEKEEILMLKQQIEKTRHGLTIVYNKREAIDSIAIEVSSSELSPYEFTESEQQLPAI